jgi:hypothetical protein
MVASGAEQALNIGVGSAPSKPFCLRQAGKSVQKNSAKHCYAPHFQPNTGFACGAAPIRCRHYGLAIPMHTVSTPQRGMAGIKSSIRLVGFNVQAQALAPIIRG